MHVAPVGLQSDMRSMILVVVRVISALLDNLQERCCGTHLTLVVASIMLSQMVMQASATPDQWFSEMPHMTHELITSLEDGVRSQSYSFFLGSAVRQFKYYLRVKGSE